MYGNLTILAGFVFLYSLISGVLEKPPFNGAILFAAFGLAVGPLGLDIIKLEMKAEGLSTLAELTLALVLFTDAALGKAVVTNKKVPARVAKYC